MKNQIIQNVFKLMLGTSALLVSVAFFIRIISPVKASNSDNPITPEIGMAVPDGTIVGCGAGIYQYDSDGDFDFGTKTWGKAGWKKVGPSSSSQQEAETKLTLEDAKAIGICEKVYNKFNGKTDTNGVAYVWKKVSDTEVTCTATDTYTLYKDSGGWRWDGQSNYINCQ